MAKLLHVYFDTDLRSAHAGLTKLLAKRKVKVSDINQGDCIAFFNRAFTRLKMFASGTQMLLYYSNGNRRIEPETVRLLPNFVSGGELDYNAALKEAIEKHFAKKLAR